MQSDAPTLPEEDAPIQLGNTASGADSALVLVWVADEPGRVGDCLFGVPGQARVFGRGGASPNDKHPRLHVMRQRPGEFGPAAPLKSERISREQIVVRGQGDALDVENIGRCALSINGDQVSRAVVHPGDVLQLGQQLLLLCVARAPGPLAARLPWPAFAFGQADPYGLVGESPACWRLREQIAFVAPRQGHVLVRGASGTGKELVAQALHSLSSRRDGSLVTRNAATIPEGLADAELFGNAKNYPNPGMAERAGLVGAAASGTLFLDEFAELPHALQAHLLRALDEGEYQRLGEATRRRSDFRLVAATNRPETSIKSDVAARFPLRIETPGLNERREDIPLIMQHLLRRIGTSDPDAVRGFFPDNDIAREPRIALELVRRALCVEYETNVRQLLNAMWEAIGAGGNVLGAGLEVRASSMPPRPLSQGPVEPNAESVPALSAVSGDESGPTAEQIRVCLDENNGSVERAWRALGLANRHALRRLIQKHGLVITKRLGGLVVRGLL